MKKRKVPWAGYVKYMLRNYPDGLTEAERRAVEEAVEETRRLKSGGVQMEIIDAMYFQKTHNMAGVAWKVGYSYDAVQNFHIQFLRRVGAHFRCEKLE